MFSKELPTILLIPGALTTPACFDWLAPLLEKDGYPVEKATLVTTNPSDPEHSTAELEGSNLLNKYILPMLEQGKDIIIFAHSFGATSCSGAGREWNLPGRILGLVYLSFAFPRDGQSQQEFLGGGEWPDWVNLDTPRKGLIVFGPVEELLYADVEGEEVRKGLVEGHLPQATKCFETPVKEPLWTDREFDGRRVYVLSQKDAIFPAEAQKMFVENCGVNWDVVEVDAGHCAFISKPAEVAKIIVDAAKKWTRRIAK